MTIFFDFATKPKNGQSLKIKATHTMQELPMKPSGETVYASVGHRKTSFSSQGSDAYMTGNYSEPRSPPKPPPPRFDIESTDTDSEVLAISIDVDSAPIRQLRMHVGKTRSATSFMPTFYVPEDIFVDDAYGPAVQTRDTGEHVAVEVPAVAEPAYYESKKKRRNSLDSQTSFMSQENRDTNYSNYALLQSAAASKHPAGNYGREKKKAEHIYQVTGTTAMSSYE